MVLALALCTLVLLAPAPLQARVATQNGDHAAAIDRVFDDIESTAPGCAAGVVRDGALTYAKGFGLANLDYGLSITPRSNFYLGSVSKQFTAAVVAHAAREGQLSLDDPIQKWIPEIPEYERPITIRHLVHHTSGLRDYLGLGTLAGWRWDDVHTDEETLAMVARQKGANFAAGEEYLYSNTGYFLLSLVIERATGEGLRDYLDRHFLGPLGMGRSRFNDDRLEIMDGRVVGYEATSDGYRMAHAWNYDKIGAGGMYSNIEDLAHWDRNFYSEEVGGRGFSEQLLTRGVLADGSPIAYAFGLSHGEYRGLATASHSGALAGFRSALLRFPDQRTTMLVLCNFPTSDPVARAEGIADVVLADALELEPASDAESDDAAEPDEGGDVGAVSLTPAQLDAFTGTWRASIGVTVQIEREGERLMFIQDGRRAPLTPVAQDMLLLPAAQIEMTLSGLDDGHFTTMAVSQGGQRFSAERIDPDAAATPVDTDLIGQYVSEELGVTYRIVEADGALALEMPPGRSGGLVGAGEDRLRALNLLVEVDRGPEGVRGFTIDAGRVRGIYFARQPGAD